MKYIAFFSLLILIPSAYGNEVLQDEKQNKVIENSFKESIGHDKSNSKLIIYSATNIYSANSTNTISIYVLDSEGQLYLGYELNDHNTPDSFRFSFSEKMSTGSKDFYLKNCLKKNEKLPIGLKKMLSQIMEISNFAQVKVFHEEFSDQGSISKCYDFHPMGSE